LDEVESSSPTSTLRPCSLLITAAITVAKLQRLSRPLVSAGVPVRIAFAKFFRSAAWPLSGTSGMSIACCVGFLFQR